ncbi:hypothetical protein SteCoe_19287 [Stentor coeruleus]|uniref:Uncharacterized protein n=1 Tax=Stentor coeruleus TaxID=5963 RepID=A0A1R2BUK3_9CILI|nr:hypothetical protein SteCoe_19287 [Stentor coeruleus]
MNNSSLKSSEKFVQMPALEFFSFLQTKLRRCPRNRAICSDFKSIDNFQHSLPIKTNLIRPEEGLKLDGSSCFMWFVLRTKKMRDLVPDIEFLKYREVCLQMISKIGNCVEAQFGLGTLQAYEGNIDAALQHIKIALSQSSADHSFNVWNAVLTVFRINSKKRALHAKKLCYELIKKGIETIEVCWALMTISLSDYLKHGVEIETPEHYAAKLKIKSDYFGALAWAEIFLKSKIDEYKGVVLLKHLIKKYPNHPEALLKLWNYYYYTLYDYASALEIIEQAFVFETGKTSEYSVVISLNYARSLYKNKKYRSCFELLQIEYTKHSLFTVILYHYGRLCVKSKDQLFLGSAIGALEETLKTCSEIRHGQIYYWLTYAYLQAEEKVEAFNCAKKSVALLSEILDKHKCFDPEYERRITRKINSLQSIIKDLHINILDIEMLEKVLEDSPPLRIEECKVYCNSIHKFDSLEGYLYEAKIFWKAGKYRKAKETLLNQLSCTRVKMKAFFALIEYLKIEGDYEYTLNLSKEMVARCRSPMIPVQMWIRANMIYAKALEKNNRVYEALLVYKSLAQVQPIPFIPDLSYTRELQRSFNKEDLDTVVMRLEAKQQRYSYLASSARDYQIQRSKLVCSRLYISPALLGDEEEEYEIMSERSKTVSTDRSEPDLVGSRAPEPLPKTRISSIPCGDSANIGFSVTTYYEFLYKIGRTCAKYSVNLKEGIHALHDFLNTHHYWTIEGIEIVEEFKVKAKFWLGILYFKTKQNNLAEEIFRDILSMLFQLGRTKMSSEAQRILKTICE